MSILTDLKNIISDMSTGEKRHFRHLAQHHIIGEKNQYLKLFDQLERGAIPDPDLLKAHQGYLMKMLVKGLTSYHREDSPSAQLREYIDRIEILFQKGYTDLAEKILVRGFSLVAELGQPLLELELFRWKRRIYRRKGKWSPKLKAELESRESHLLEIIHGETVSLQIHDHIYELMQTGLPISNSSPSSPSAHSFPGAMPSFPANPPDSFLGGRSYFSSLGAWAKYSGDKEGAVAAFKENLEVWIKYPRHIANLPDKYFAALSNYLSSLHQLKRYDEYEKAMEAYSQPQGLTKELSVILKAKTTNLSLILAINICAWENARRAATDLQQMVKSLSIDQIRTYRYNLAIFFFLVGDLGASLKKMVEINQMKKSSHRLDLQGLAEIWELILYLERDHTTVFKSRMRSVQRRQSKLLLPSVWPLLQQLLHALSKERRSYARKKLVEKFLATTPQHEEKGLEEIWLWLRSKAAGVTPAELLEKELE